MRPLLFAVNASGKAGLGHLMRCLALAQAAESQDIPCVFLLEPTGMEVARARTDWHYSIRQRPEKASMVEQGEWLNQVAGELKAAAIIVDGYDFSEQFLAAIKTGNHCIVVMDDGAKTLVSQANIVVNPAASTDTTEYQAINPSVTSLTGSDYRLLRREFIHIVPPPVAKRNGLALNLGGSDPLELTLPLLKLLERDLNDVPVRVVTGAAFAQLTQLEDFISSSSLAIQHIHNCQDMSEVWMNAKLAISAAGGSQFELGVCQTPSLLLVVADNQIHAAEKAAEEGWCEQFDCRKTAPLEEVVARAKKLLNDERQLTNMAQASHGKYDAQGAFRVLAAIGEAVRDR